MPAIAPKGGCCTSLDCACGGCCKEPAGGVSGTVSESDMATPRLYQLCFTTL